MKAFSRIAWTAMVALVLSSQAAGAAQRYYGTPVSITLPPRDVDFGSLAAQANAGLTIPFFTNHVTSPLDHLTYTFQIVGSDPTAATKSSTTVSYVPVALRVHFADGTVLDPTMPGCGDTVAVATRFFSSPLFMPTVLHSNGVSVGTTQIIDGFQRAEFWALVHGTNYHLLLAPAAAMRLIDVTAPSGSKTVTGACAGKGHRLGEIPIGGWDKIVVKQANSFATPAQLPLVLAYNVVETSGGQCCIIGYHNAYGRTTGTQTYATAAYTDGNIFSPGLQDIHAWTHEIGEWANDPFINNVTPAWGHTGQVSGCQNNLEVGDPLTGTPFLDTLNGFTYHPQEMAFFSWFFRTSSIGTSADYSWNESFESAQGVCI